MIKPYFGDIRKILCDRLRQAKYDVYIAVAWITDKVYEEILLSLLKKGVSVNIISIDDDINKNGNFDWKQLVKNGANVFWDHHHHKFCVIDRRTVITGSFNWTYTATNRMNRENIIVIEDEQELIEQFSTEFMVLKSEATRFDLPIEKVVEHIFVEKPAERLITENITSLKKYKANQSSGKLHCGKCGDELKWLNTDYQSVFSKHTMKQAQTIVPPRLKMKAAYVCESCGAFYDKEHNYL